MQFTRIRLSLIDLLNKILSQSNYRSLDLDIPEDRFIRYAGSEGILSYIYYYLVKHRRVLNLSPESEDKLKEYYFMISALNIRINDNLKRFIELIHDHGINDFVILKGAHLINDIYDNPAVRPMGDVDVLFKKSDFPVFKKVLHRMGFKFSRDATRGYNFKKGESVLFDLMTFEGDYYTGKLRKKLSPLNYATVKDFTGTISLDNIRVPVLKPDINLILFADHARKHFYNRLIWFLDFILLFKKSRMKFSQLIRLAERLKLEKSVYYMFYLVNTYFPEQLPRINNRVSGLEKKILAGIMEGKIAKGNSYLYFLSLKNPVDKIYLVLKKVFPSGKEMTYIYDTQNNIKLFFLYCLRPFMILITFINNLKK